MKKVPSRAANCRKAGYVLTCYVNGRKRFKVVRAEDDAALGCSLSPVDPASDSLSINNRLIDPR